MRWQLADCRPAEEIVELFEFLPSSDEWGFHGLPLRALGIHDNRKGWLREKPHRRGRAERVLAPGVGGDMMVALLAEVSGAWRLLIYNRLWKNWTGGGNFGG